MSEIAPQLPSVGANRYKARYVEAYGYPVESYWVTTRDGYVLYLVRIPFGKKDRVRQNRPPVLIMHGLLSSSQDWVAYGENRSLPYFCVENGYDVWLGNFRGAPGSVNHEFLNLQTDSEKFWDISWTELGLYDLPALIDFILKKTNHEKLFYIGHSQAGSSFFTMVSELPEYNSKIRLANVMASVTQLSHPTNEWLIAVARLWKALWSSTRALAIYEVPVINILRTLGKVFCPSRNSVSDLCNKFLFLINSYDVQGQLPTSFVPDLFNNYPASASMTQVIHLLQLIDSRRWQKLDYGPTENYRRYGTEIPPLYDTSRATSPVAYYHSTYDLYTNARDARDFAATIPNLVLFYTIPYKRFNHIDFVIGKDAIALLYNKVIETMRNF
ncbi:hypothetical protein WA026_006314 [Henosepilachna vigintioctopunctata]|uniref:Lipase n=1 Tax=Henosepilachna vigintioctopunctata TaxID=420089 RepID=A0AAW1TR33_9CUCU